ncbi:MAG: sulfite exporter TauE/SafE family protein, partial [Victivallales bacterium]|nr:sulfite exporter TauE/SafE family protein [Victivallales bacterium]
MFTSFYAGLDSVQIIVLMASAILIGINKTAIPGIGVLPVIMLTMAFESKLSTGIQLIMLIMADLIAVAWYRRKADWRIIWRLLPWAWFGLAVGALVLGLLPEDDGRIMRMLIGGIVLLLAAFNFIRSRLTPDKIPSGKIAGGFYGTLLGFTTHLANAAGPIAAIY